MTDEELLAKFREMHPTYTAATLQKILFVGHAMSFRILKKQKLEPYQRRLLRIYLDIPAFYRQLYFPL